ncbi:SPOR domain-containing protein [Dysgonomonas sp. 511]|uniref:SPOR domain-containing protein n=1 Tax=Dysgonomonas sp. 511 TaxID=2302930 RepID=UPI0013D6C042|nr:SPOR domain-containing protein [Dysgonomonas sp. 511]NDV79253.1 SPOR domain-containing protein [Dysgonomonas sp. 511]
MKTYFLFLTSFCICFLSLPCIAQDGHRTIIEDLNSRKAGQGRITVMQDETIDKILGIRQEIDTTKKLGYVDPNAEYVKVKGFKIQVFSGNNQQRSKREAESKKAQVRSAFPELEAVVNFQSPVWRLRVGNFVKKEDAETVLKEMKKKLPSLGREMYVVSDVVKRVVE